MPFCPKCGHQVDGGHKFCYKCGAQMPAIKSEVQHKSEEQTTELKKEIPVPVIDPKKSLSTYSIDRKILFDDGMLTLTSSDLILSSSDEKDELKRIPLSIIENCSYSMLSRGLVVKRRANVEENLVSYLAQLEDDIEDFQKGLNVLDEKIEEKYDEIEDLEKEVKKAEYQEDAEELENQMDNLENKIEQHEKEKSDLEEKIEKTKTEKNSLESDNKKVKDKENELADIEKEVFKLPKDFSADHSTKDEYKLWGYAVNRRIEGPSKLKVTTEPYDAIVTINEEVVGTTPLVIELPMNDKAILDGKYPVEVLKEGYEVEAFNVSTDYGKAFLKEFGLKEQKEPDVEIEKEIRSMRKLLPDRSIDLSTYDIEKEFVGQNEALLLCENTLMILDKKKANHLYEIPFGMIQSAKYHKGFLGDKSVEISFKEKEFGEQSFKIWLDDKGGTISDAEIKQYSESLVENLKRKMKLSKTIVVPRHTHAKEFYSVTERDITNNFKRFNPEDFEHLIAKLFNAKGYKTQVTQYQGDFGVDVIAESGSQKAVIQVKHWKNNVGSPDVQKTLGSMFKYGANQAIVITSSDFTNQAYETMDGNTPLELWNGEKVQQEISEYLVTN